MRRIHLTTVMLILGVLLGAPSSALALTSVNNSPFPSSNLFSGAHWTTSRQGPPGNQFGDILPTPWADDNNLYTLIDDGGTDAPGSGALWRNSFARITGTPLHGLQFQRVGAPPPHAATWPQIRRNRSLWSGPLGEHYATGFTSVNHVFYATQVQDWNWSANNPFNGLSGIAYSTNHGQSWQQPGKAFPGAIGNLNWIQLGRDTPANDGYVYAIATEREFNANTLILGRSRPDIADMTDPSRWQWVSAWVPYQQQPWPVWSSSIRHAKPILRWNQHLTYPRISYDAPLHRYLLTFTHSFAATPPAIWQNGSELEIMEGPHPWGPFSFVASGSNFGPSNGYDPAFPVKWISGDGLNLWMIWAANFDGCASGLDCSGGYGFNYQRLHLTPATYGVSRAHRQSRARSSSTRQAAAGSRTHPATPPPFQLPRLYLSPGK